MLKLPDPVEFLPLIPEMTLVAGAFALLMLDLFIDARRRVVTHVLSIALLVVVIVLISLGVGGQGTVLSGMFVRDGAADLLKVCIAALSAISLVYTWPYLRQRDLYQGEVAVLMLFATAGMMLLVSAGNLVMVYLGLEMLALCAYALIAIDRDSPVASEAAIKSFVLGSLASGLLLYGMSLVYGATGTLDLTLIAQAAAVEGQGTLLITGVVFMVAGIAFKFGGAPFHMWLPDVYHGAPTPVTLFIGSAPKLAYFGMVWRLLETGAAPLDYDWRYMLALVAAASLVLGNLIAVVQSNLKRLLAYSTISHVGFLCVGLAGGGGEAGASAAGFYAITYGFMATAAFGMIAVMSSRGFEADRVEDFRGLSTRSPWMAFLVLCVMASLAGVPPFLGFWSKLAVITAAVDGGYLWLAILAVVCAVIGAFYYLRVVKAMYFEQADGDAPAAGGDRAARWVFAANALGLLVVGLGWNRILAWCEYAFA